MAVLLKPCELSGVELLLLVSYHMLLERSVQVHVISYINFECHSGATNYTVSSL